jgi:hypothetical protein
MLWKAVISLDAPVIVVVTAVLAFFVGFGIEGAALVLLYQIGMLLLHYAKEHTKKAALDLLQDMDEGIVTHMRELLSDDEKTFMSIQKVMESSAGMVLKLAILVAIIYAIAMPIITSMSFIVSIHRALIILLVATPFSIVASIPMAPLPERPSGNHFRQRLQYGSHGGCLCCRVRQKRHFCRRMPQNHRHAFQCS